MRLSFKTLICATLLTVSALSNASPITSAEDAALIGATLQDFNTATTGTYTSLAIPGVALSSKGSFQIQSGKDGQLAPPNSSGDIYVRSVQNSRIRFTFNNAVSAFGFVIGATNAEQALTAYDISGNVLETLLIPDQVATQPFPYSGYFGIASSSTNIASFSVASDSNDVWILDDLSYVSSVPEPTMIGLLGLALGGIGFSRRRTLGKA